MVRKELAIQSNLDLYSYNTLQVHATARKFAVIQNESQLQALLTDSKWNKNRIFVLGGGSNVLFLNDFEGLILHITIKGKQIVRENEDHVWLSIGAGENWHQTVRYCVDKGWGGIENLSLIPGTVGAAPIQNIGAYGVELSDVFEELTAVELQTGQKVNLAKAECQFGYRDSIFKGAWKNRYVVTKITLKLSKNLDLNTSYGAIKQKLAEKNINDPTIRDISNTVIEIRNSKLPDPACTANAGSFFKNPIVGNETFQKISQSFSSMPGYRVDGGHTKIPAGWLIEKTGWKGKKVGEVGTYRQQALVIINHGGASGKEIWQVAKEIQHAVRKKFNLELVPEVNIVS